MLIRLLILLFLLSACRSGEIACPEVKAVKLRKKPGNYRIQTQDKTVTASTQERPTARVPSQVRNTKTIASIEEWDCPRPGAKTPMPKSVKENIKKNRKKFDDYYKKRSSPDSVTTQPSAATNRK
jgi:hypothetical protein